MLYSDNESTPGEKARIANIIAEQKNQIDHSSKDNHVYSAIDFINKSDEELEKIFNELIIRKNIIDEIVNLMPDNKEVVYYSLITLSDKLLKEYKYLLTENLNKNNKNDLDTYLKNLIDSLLIDKRKTTIETLDDEELTKNDNDEMLYSEELETMGYSTYDQDKYGIRK